MLWLAAALASPLVYPDDAHVQLADADGDGHQDVVLNAGEAVHYGDGLGGFGPLTPLTADPDAEGWVLLVDLDGDGLPEACREQWDRIDCHQGVGRGLGPVMATIPERTFGMLAVDADGDGDQDLIVSTLDGITVHDNDGSGLLTAGIPSGTAIPDRFLEADVDGDGDLDVAAVARINDDAHWLERDDTTGILGPAQYLNESNATSVGFADVSGDGVPDFLSQSYTFPIYGRARRSDGTYGTSLPIGGHTGPFEVVALDPGAQPGLLVCDDDEVRWDPAIDGITTTLWSAPEPSDRLCRPSVADLDGDGLPDVLTAARGLTITLDPLGAAISTTLQQSSSAMGPVATGDIDGDGHVDIVYASDLHDDLWAVRGAGGGRVHAVETLLSGTTQLTDLTVLDLTGDGIADIGMTDRGGNIALLVGTGSGAFAAPVVLGGGARGEGVALDVDQDGVQEWAVPTSGGISVFDDDGLGGTVGNLVFIGASNAAATGDTDGDGQPELVALASGELVVLRTGAGGLVEDLRAPAPGRSPFDLVLLDADGDGRDHIVVMGECEQAPDPYYGGLMCVTEERLYEVEEAGGALTASGVMAEANGPMAVLDWDGDGLQELLTAQGGSCVQLDASFAVAPFPARCPAIDWIPVDLDDDGDLDVVEVQVGGMWAVWSGDIAPEKPGDSGHTGDTGHTADTGSPTTPTTPSTTADTGPILTDTGPGADPSADPGCGCAQERTVSWHGLARRR